MFEIHAKNVPPSVFQFTRRLCSWECSCSRYMLIMYLHLCFSLRGVCVPGNVRVRNGNPHVCLGSRPLLLFCLQPVSSFIRVHGKFTLSTCLTSYLLIFSHPVTTLKGNLASYLTNHWVSQKRKSFCSLFTLYYYLRLYIDLRQTPNQRSHLFNYETMIRWGGGGGRGAGEVGEGG